MTTDWTPERRAALAQTMRDRHASRKAAAVPLVSDTVETPSPVKLKPARSQPQQEKPKTIVAATAGEHDASALISALAALPLDSLTYDDCGLLLNALSSASTAVALTRRQRQEQLAAGTHKASCTTCGRTIDISKPGGYQILTVRDEYFQPKNVFFCSQNCLLARNMPSHAQQERIRKQKTGAST